MFDSAAAGISAQGASLAHLATAILEIMVLLGAIGIATQVGASNGLQKHLREIVVVLFVVALLVKGYTTLVTGAMSMF